MNTCCNLSQRDFPEQLPVFLGIAPYVQLTGSNTDDTLISVLIVIIVILASIVMYLLFSLRRARVASRLARAGVPSSVPQHTSVTPLESSPPVGTRQGEAEATEDSAPGVYGRLIVVKGLPEKEIVIPCDVFTIGRSEGNGCDYTINQPFISPRHCTIFCRGGEYLVKDLGSKNGTFVNGERLPRMREIIVPVGSEIEITRNIALELWDPNTKIDIERDQESALYETDDGRRHDEVELSFKPTLDIPYAADDGIEVSDDYSPL